MENLSYLCEKCKELENKYAMDYGRNCDMC